MGNLVKEIKERYGEMGYTLILFIFLEIFYWLLKFLALFFAMFIEQAKAEGPISDFLIGLASYPSFFLDIYPKITAVDGTKVISAGEGFFHPRVVLIDMLFWGGAGLFIGFLIALIIKGYKLIINIKTGRK